MKKFGLLYNIIIISIFLNYFSWAQTTILDDDFEDGNLVDWTEGTSSDWANSTSFTLK